ncbi:hypothetical protein C8F01DRAFT_799809 [Mycena amicta]|nr:hypothetical protein C8F01DRAFT_799809 [Mycena amicta]
MILVCVSSNRFLPLPSPMDFPSHFLRRAGPTPEELIILFNILVAVALGILMLSVLVARFSGLGRMKTWYYLQLSSAWYCLSFLLLVGRQTGPEPPLHFCALSAALIYAAPPMVAATAFFFAIELHLRLSSALSSRPVSDIFMYSVTRAIPVSHGVPFWVSLITGLSDASKIKRDPSGVYCHIVDNKLPTLLTGTLVFVFVVSMLIMEAFTIVHLFQKRVLVQAKRVSLKASDFPFRLFVRTVLYTIVAGFAVLVTILMNTNGIAATVSLLAVVPLSVALVFGTQKELLRAVFRCQFRRRASPLSDSSSV